MHRLSHFSDLFDVVESLIENSPQGSRDYKVSGREVFNGNSLRILDPETKAEIRLQASVVNDIGALVPMVMITHLWAADSSEAAAFAERFMAVAALASELERMALVVD